jgi:plasmid stabilization system protein ParE
VKRGGFAVRFTPTARADLQRLLDFLIDRAAHTDALTQALATIDALEAEVQTRLSQTPYLYRHAEGDPLLRELVVAGPAQGYLALYEITDAQQVTVIAVRHQLEDDYL